MKPPGCSKFQQVSFHFQSFHLLLSYKGSNSVILANVQQLYVACWTSLLHANWKVLATGKRWITVSSEHWKASFQAIMNKKLLLKNNIPTLGRNLKTVRKKICKQKTLSQRTPRWKRHLELVPGFLYSLYLTLYEIDVSLKRTLSAGPKESIFRGTQRRFPPKYIKKFFRLSRVLLDLLKCILRGAIKFVSVRLC